MITLIKLKALKRRLEDLAGSWMGGIPDGLAIPLKEQFEDLQKIAIKENPGLFADFKPQGYGAYQDGGHWNKLAIKSVLSDVNYFINILENIEMPSVNNLKLSKEGIYFAGHQFDAFVKIVDIIKEAKTEIILIDGYVDEKLIEVFKEKNPITELKILTKSSSYSSSLQQTVTKFNAQYKKLEIKTSEKFHDRFLIIDRQFYYHFGASIKDAGNRGFMFSLIEEDSIRKSILQEFEKEWK